jgi:hypothetical protein
MYMGILKAISVISGTVRVFYGSTYWANHYKKEIRARPGEEVAKFGRKVCR